MEWYGGDEVKKMWLINRANEVVDKCHLEIWVKILNERPMPEGASKYFCASFPPQTIYKLHLTLREVLSLPDLAFSN